MSCTEPGSAGEIHSGNPSGRAMAWTSPPLRCALPEYHRSMTSPCTLTVFSRHLSVGITLPSFENALMPGRAWQWYRPENDSVAVNLSVRRHRQFGHECP